MDSTRDAIASAVAAVNAAVAAAATVPTVAQVSRERVEKDSANILAENEALKLANAKIAAEHEELQRRVSSLLREREELSAKAAKSEKEAAFLQRRVEDGEVWAKQLEEQVEASTRRVAALQEKHAEQLLALQASREPHTSLSLPRQASSSTNSTVASSSCEGTAPHPSGALGRYKANQVLTGSARAPGAVQCESSRVLRADRSTTSVAPVRAAWGSITRFVSEPSSRSPGHERPLARAQSPNPDMLSRSGPLRESCSPRQERSWGSSWGSPARLTARPHASTTALLLSPRTGERGGSTVTFSDPGLMHSSQRPVQLRAIPARSLSPDAHGHARPTTSSLARCPSASRPPYAWNPGCVAISSQISKHETRPEGPSVIQERARTARNAPSLWAPGSQMLRALPQ